MLDIPLFLLGLNADGGLPNPIAVSDFKNGIYSINGVSKTVGQLWEQDLDWVPWNSATDIVPGVGVFYTSTGVANARGPQSTAELSAVITPASGFTAVIDASVSAPFNTFGILIQSYVIGGPFDSYLAAYYLSDHNGYIIKDSVAEGIDYGVDQPTGLHRIAFTLAAGLMSMSVDGGGTITHPTAIDTSAFNRVGFLLLDEDGTVGSTLGVEKITFYSQQMPSVLPLLSA